MGPRAVSIAAAAVALVAAILVGGASAQSSSGCTQTLISMSPCLNYITGNETTPSKSCCSALGTVVTSKPECLCVALNSDPAALGIDNVNKTRALGLPDACAVTTPPLSNCASAPTTSPSSGTPASPSAGAGSKTTPDIGNGGSSLQRSAGIVAGFIVAVVYAVSGL
uniref:Uncharacterized protein n=1 Tax=Avena sativa TaxID=4498 RepID=A0ACD5UY18_AVESA